MAKIHFIYQQLRAIPDRSVDQAIAQAMPTADPDSLTIMAQTLLERKRGPGLTALVEHYHRLNKDLQEKILQHAPELTRALRLAMSSKQAQSQANTVYIIRRSLATRQAYLIADQLRKGHDKLKDESARCLLEMAQTTTPTPTTSPQGEAPPRVDPVEAGYIQTAVQEAIRFQSQHKRKNVLQAAFSLPMPAVAKVLRSLKGIDESLIHETGVTLTRGDTPAARRALLIALSVEGLGSYVLDGIRMCADTGKLADALSHWHLLLLRRNRVALARAKRLEGFCPDPSAYNGEQTHPHGLAPFIGTLPLDVPTRVRQLAAMREASDPHTRLFALRRLLELAQDSPPDAPAHSAIAGFCTDASEPIARLALAHLVHSDSPATTRVLAKLVNSPHEQVQRIASRRLAPVAFSRLWENWPNLNREQRLGAGRALIKIDPKFHTTLADQLTLTDKATRLRALSIVSELNQGVLVQDKLLRLTSEKDPYVVSAAVRALGSAEPDVAAPVIESALNHEDERVRANAVEAMGRLDAARNTERIVEMTHNDQSSRARANAIQALLQTHTTDALHALSDMLNDPRPRHRVSALWLVESMGIASVARDVAEMSISESDPNVRQRAGRVIAEIIDQMSQPLPIDVLKFEGEDPEAALAVPGDRVAG